MKRSKATRAIAHTAAQNGVSVAEVRKEMQKAIDIAFKNRDKDAFTKAFWGKWRGRKPTPEEFIIAVSKKTMDILDFNTLMKQ